MSKACESLFPACLVEYRGQLCTGRVIRKFGFLRRIQLDVTGGGYRLVWVPSWKTNA